MRHHNLETSADAFKQQSEITLRPALLKMKAWLHAERQIAKGNLERESLLAQQRLDEEWKKAWTLRQADDGEDTHIKVLLGEIKEEGEVR